MASETPQGYSAKLLMRAAAIAEITRLARKQAQDAILCTSRIGREEMWWPPQQAGLNDSQHHMENHRDTMHNLNWDPRAMGAICYERNAL